MQGRSGRGRKRDRADDAAALAAAVGGLVKPGSVPAFLAAHRRDLFPDADFADLFPRPPGGPRSRPTW